MYWSTCFSTAWGHKVKEFSHNFLFQRMIQRNAMLSSTPFPRSLFFPPPGAGGRKRRDPGNEAVLSLANSTITSHQKGMWYRNERYSTNEINYLTSQQNRLYEYSTKWPGERCDFGAAKDDAIRDRLVVGISDKELSQRLHLKLCDAITDILQAEVVKVQVSAQLLRP